MDGALACSGAVCALGVPCNLTSAGVSREGVVLPGETPGLGSVDLGWNLVFLVGVREARGCLRFSFFTRATPRPHVPNWTDPLLSNTLKPSNTQNRLPEIYSAKETLKHGISLKPLI